MVLFTFFNILQVEILPRPYPNICAVICLHVLGSYLNIFVAGLVLYLRVFLFSSQLKKGDNMC